jgi:hypothetical protein
MGIGSRRRSESSVVKRSIIIAGERTSVVVLGRHERYRETS